MSDTNGLFIARYTVVYRILSAVDRILQTEVRLCRVKTHY